MSSSNSSKNYKQLGEDAWKRSEKISGELFGLTYGVLVAQLCRELPTIKDVNRQLFRMGHSIGTRLIDEFLAKCPLRLPTPHAGRVIDWNDAMEMVAKMGIKQFLGVNATIVRMDDKECVISLESDGLGGEWVELPETVRRDGLRYANIIAGCVSGALEMVNLEVEAEICSDPFIEAPATTTEIKVKFVKYLEEAIPPSNED